MTDIYSQEDPTKRVNDVNRIARHDIGRPICVLVIHTGLLISLQGHFYIVS
ncbi:hypothetical protein GcM1_192037 [Golovinomyces cichoracearum]|uniref:Uncharacterized protein n=1 Tax=Golovinomyces cichoracearum TaxID=62708 RepID=A0A420J179_9PEZI|nr:hypothetical protein GcM1_192037 [Golovinomyces cichoracearum]